MNADPSRARLRLLEQYLAEDPRNLHLLAEGFDAALACGALDQATGFVEGALQMLPGDAPWTFRQARCCVRARDLDTAARLLDALAPAEDLPARVLLHDRVHVRLLQSRHEEARALLEPHLPMFTAVPADPADAAAVEALQAVWLRVLHRMARLHEAWEWVVQQRDAGRLALRAQGVASLIALDLGNFGAAQALADAALDVDPFQVEALVASGCVALARQQTDDGIVLLKRALEQNDQDGRIWSALGYASLQRGDLPRAGEQLERALRHVPEHVGTWHALGWARLLQRDLLGARMAFEAALERDRNFAETHGALGLLQVLQGRTDDAGQHLAAADRLDRRNVTGRYARAVLAGEAADSQQIRSLARRLLDRPGFFGGTLGDSITARAPVTARLL